MKFYSICCAVLLASCSQHPGGFAGDRSAAIKLNKNFQSQAIETPEITDSLLSLFSSPALRATVESALQNNPDIKLAKSRLLEAGFNTDSVSAAKLPSLDHRATAGRRRTNSNFGNNSSGNYSQSFDATWELDIWGQTRASLNASKQDQQAAKADYEAARQSIAAQTMQAWFDLTASEQLLNLANRRLSSFKKTRSLINLRFEAGTAELGDLDLADIDLQTAKSTVAQRTDARDQAARRIGVLTGKYPSKNVRNSSFGNLRRGVRAGVPSTVLLKRPDVSAAYQRILAADSRITVAHRDQFPKFNLTSSVGSSADQLQKLAESSFSTWSLLANLSTPLFDAGRRKAALGVSEKRAEQAYLSYQKVVLQALSEVENALGSETYLKQREVYSQKALTAAKSAEQRVQRQYEAGLVEILSLLDTQRRRFTSEENLITIKSARFKNRVSLALAVGKGI